MRQGRSTENIGRMCESSWTDAISAIATAVTAALTLALVIMAWVAWKTASATLNESAEASRAARDSANAAMEANEQAKRDSIEQTRPYVYAEIVTGLASTTAWDLRVVNTGKSAARNVTITFDSWPDEIDDVGTSLREMFEHPRTIPPGASLRVMWRLEGNFTDGTTEAGLGKTGTLTFRYTSDDPIHPEYSDSFDVQIEKSGLWPVGEQGPNADALRGAERKFYLLGQALVRRIAELGR